MCDLYLNPTSRRIWTTPLGIEINEETKMADDQASRWYLSSTSNQRNILCPTTVDQLPEDLGKDLEAKNAAKGTHNARLYHRVENN